MALVQETAGPIGLDVLRESQAETLIGSLEAIEGPKTVLIEDGLFTALLTIIDLKTLEAHNVVSVNPLTSKIPAGAARTIVYILRPSTHSLHLVGDQILSARNTKEAHDFCAFFVTRFPHSVEKLLDCYHSANLFAELDRHVETLDLHWFPMDTDVLSMELPYATRTALVEHSLVDIHAFALGLHEIERLYGPIARVRGKGDVALRVAETLRQLRAESGEAVMSKRPEIRELIIIDRSFDPVTPLMTQLTYEGLIYEAFKTRVIRPTKLNTIVANKLNVDGPLLEYGPDTIIRADLCSNDPVLRLIRDEPMGLAVKRVAKEIEDTSKLYKATGELQSKSISHLREYTLALKEAKEKEPYLALHNRIIKYIRTHTSTRAFNQKLSLEATLVRSRVGTLSWGTIYDQFEAMALSQRPLEDVLRLLALISLTQDGVDSRRLESARRLVVECYGHQHILTLLNLETAGLLTARAITGAQAKWFSKVGKRLGTTFDGAKVETEDTSHNSFASYRPLSTQFVRYCLSGVDGKDAFKEDGGSRGPLADTLALAPGEYFDFELPVSTKAARDVVAVAFFGGVTSAEISILRSLATEIAGRGGQSPEILVLTTGITEGNSFIAQFYQGTFPCGPYNPRDFAGSGFFKNPSLWDIPQQEARKVGTGK